MKKLLFVLLAALIFSSCASTTPMGDRNTYIEKSLADIVNSDLMPGEAYNKSDGKGNQIIANSHTYRLVVTPDELLSILIAR